MTVFQNLSLHRLWNRWWQRGTASPAPRRHPILLGAPRLGERSGTAPATRRAKQKRVGAAARRARSARHRSSRQRGIHLDAELRARFPYVAALLAELNHLASESREAAASRLRSAVR